MVHALSECVGGQVAGARIASLGEEIGIVTMRGRIRYLVTIRRSHTTEVGIASREKVHRPRLEAIPPRGDRTSAGQRGASDPFMGAMLPAALDRAEGRGGPRSRHSPDQHHGQRSHQAQPSATP